MMSMRRFLGAAIALMLCLQPASAGTIKEVIDELNSSPNVEGSEGIKSYRILFDAYLDMTPPPSDVGRDFNQATIHPNIPDWEVVADWAAGNDHMAEAIIRSRERQIIGLPYGRENVSQAYREAGIMVEIGAGGSLRNNRFTYLDAVDTIMAYATAEVYRRFETNDVDGAIELAMATLFVARQFCDRDFLYEKNHSILLLSGSLSNLRDMLYLYRDQISTDQFRVIATREIPFLRPGRDGLFMPEADRVVSEALIREAFDDRGRADREAFPEIFAAVQASGEPLTWFGAARRWAMIADVHGSLEASLERLTLIYDDWWRRWRVQEYDPILDIPTELERTNPIRYAAVIHSIQDIEDLFDVRTELIASVNGTSMAAAVSAYHGYFGNYPRELAQTYGQFVRKSTDVDPFDRSFGHFIYRRADERRPIDTGYGRIWVERGQGILYSRGRNHDDDRAERHTADGSEGDIVFWPPIKAYAREQGLAD